MGERNVWSILRPVAASEARAVIADALTAMPGPRPHPSYEVSSRSLAGISCGDTLTLADGAWPLSEEIAARRGILNIELRIQEGDHWDFTLQRGRDVIADFSTRVGYFDDRRSSPRPWKRGSADVLASAWGVDLASVLPYLVDWDSLRKPRRATETSRFMSHDCWEVLDFMGALGAIDPLGHPERFEFQLPCWQYAIKR